jgi:hypothetical protein
MYVGNLALGDKQGHYLFAFKLQNIHIWYVVLS